MEEGKITIEVREISSNEMQHIGTQHKNTNYKKERKVKNRTKRNEKTQETQETQEDGMEQVMTAEEMNDRLLGFFTQK